MGSDDIRDPFSRSARPLARRVVRPVQEFLHREVASGINLAVATLLALLWANLSPHGYEAFWHAPITFGVGDWSETKPLYYVINDGLMTLFFFVIGLEVKRELAVGELADRRAATLPLFAAVGGMLVPALIFLAVVRGDQDVAAGWGVPMATDIAFALGALALLGSRVPIALKVFLLGVAVIDDIGAIIVIAIFYSGAVDPVWLAISVVLLAAVAALARVNVRSLVPYVVLGVGAWFAMFESGIHATLAGVILGLLTPALPYQRGDAVSDVAHDIAQATRDDPDDPDKDLHHWHRLSCLSREAVSPLSRLEHALHPWTAGLVLPLFALANVGIVFDLDTVRGTLEQPLALGIAAGLVIGKPLGIVVGAAVAVKVGITTLPDSVTWRHVLGAGAFAGIGFTMSLFITNLAFEDTATIDQATLAVLVASIVAGVAGVALLTGARVRERR